MSTDEQGFLYPMVDEETCIDCQLCVKVCPFSVTREEREPLEAYAAWNEDEQIRLSSSSGGVFTSLAQMVLGGGGVVFGARFNETWDVVHDYAEIADGLLAFRGSKYVQSVIGDNYIKAERFLKSGRQVLFSGTPCQIAGLKSFLSKDYDNLLTVEVVCHGAPSPMVWRDYLSGLTDGFSPEAIAGISFRDKSNSWRNYDVTVFSHAGAAEERKVLSSGPYYQNTFMRAFLRNLDLRPSCYECPFKSFTSGSDITLGDFWGVEKVMPHLLDKRGVSLVAAHTERGKTVLAQSHVCLNSCKLSDALTYNPAIARSSVKSEAYDYFWALYPTHRTAAIEKAIRKVEPLRLTTLLRRIVNKISQLIGK